jgi:TPR repeat protein
MSMLNRICRGEIGISLVCWGIGIGTFMALVLSVSTRSNINLAEYDPCPPLTIENMSTEQCEPETSKSPLDHADADLASLYDKAKAKNAKAQRQLAERYMRADGVEKNHDKAYHWYRKAAEQGDHVAQLYVGFMLGLGSGVIANKREGMEWIKKSAHGGIAAAQTILGVFLIVGDTTSTNREEGLHWLRKAAEQGDKRAAYMLRKIVGGMKSTGWSASI